MDVHEADVVERDFHTRWIYFGLFAWLQTFGRFTALYYQNEGLTDAEIGMVFAAGNLSAPLLNQLFNYLADRAAAKHGPVARMYFFSANIVWATICWTLQAIDVTYHVTGLRPFYVMLVVRMSLAFAYSGCCGLLDAITIQGLRNRHDYGKERLYGAYSWAIVGIVLGILMDNLSMGTRVTHFAVPVAAVVVLAAVVAAGHPPEARSLAEARGTTSSASEDVSGGALCALLKSYSKISTVSFFVFAIFLGIGMALVENLIFLYFHELNASYTVMGLSIVVTIVFEIPLFAASPKLLATFGTRGLLVIAGLCWVIRGVGYTLIPKGDGVWILLFEPLHGVTYAAWQTASVEVMAEITPSRLAATGQTFLGSLRGLAGTATGNLFGGMVISKFGEATLYRGVAALIALGLVQYLIIGRAGKVATRRDCEDPLNTAAEGS
eukprot:TRINITY_DN13095_c0_g1_i1.p1 TRINITY_DN13095_c0_g1~~TRINITY_DN13095_c0_g1_i1.p1  ORF type:complete len:437 (+),score=53.32 TRINITY_DN13095_c0_g1_i1:124-1434(+)